MKIGVTGLYASGKGTVCRIFEELGASVIDTDIIAREIVEPGSGGLNKLIEFFGKKILNSNGELNRRKLAGIVFKDPEKVSKINSITHPLILKKVMDIVNSSPDVIYVINTPLLFESGFDRFMDKNIVVSAGINQSIERGKKRDNLSENEIIERLNNQIPLNEKIEKADYVIDNSSSIDNTKRQVLKIWKILTKEIKQD